MYGLRLINNNYVAAGDGRDLMINYDANFRGGKRGNTDVIQFFPKPQAGPSKARKHVTLGFNARTEAAAQTLNCSRSSFHQLRDAKARLGSLRPITAPVGDAGARSSSTPSRAEPFRPRWEHVKELDFRATDTALAHRTEKQLTAPRPTKPHEPWNDQCFVPSRSGFSRDPGGGIWPH